MISFFSFASLIQRNLPAMKSDQDEIINNYSARLKEFCMANDLMDPTYTQVDVSGPPHAKIFVMKCSVDEHTTTGNILSCVMCC